MTTATATRPGIGGSGRETLSVHEVAELLGISGDTVERRVAEGRFPRPLPLGRRRRWSASVVRAWLESGGAMTEAESGRPRK